MLPVGILLIRRGDVMISPYKGRFRVSQVYKWVIHKGMDLVGIDSKNLYATANAVVDAAGWDINPKNPLDRKYGMGLRLRLKEEGTNRRIYYGHCEAIYVFVGQKVRKGDLVALEGSTGKSTGRHCHYEIRETTDNSTFLDVSKISGIPNKLGIYGEEEEPEVTQEEFNEKMKVYLEEQKKLEPSDWSAQFREWAEEKELIVGDDKGNKQYKAPVTREQLTVIMKRLYELK